MSRSGEREHRAESVMRAPLNLRLLHVPLAFRMVLVVLRVVHVHLIRYGYVTGRQARALQSTVVSITEDSVPIQ